MLRFLCRDPKDRQHLDHNLNDYVAHNPGRSNVGIYLEPAEKMFNAVKDFDKLALAGARIFSRLCLISK